MFISFTLSLVLVYFKELDKTRDSRSTFKGADVSLKMIPDFSVNAFSRHRQRNCGSGDKAAAPNTSTDRAEGVQAGQLVLV